MQPEPDRRLSKNAPRLGSLAALVAAGLLVMAATAGAAVTSTTTGSVVASAMVGPQSPLASLPAGLALPPNATLAKPTAFPVGTSTSAIAPFPFDTSYAVLTTGDVRLSDKPGGASSADDGAGPGVVGHGNSAYDASIFSLGRISVPASQTDCLSFNFRFLSAE